MLVLISEVSSKFRIIKILFAWFTNTTTKAFGHFCRQRLCSRPMHLWSTLQCCLETKPKRASSSPADNVLDSQADSHWSTVLQRLQDNTKGQIWKSWLAAQPQGLAQAWGASCVFVHFSGKWHSHSQPRQKFFLLALYLRGVLSSLSEGYFNFLLHQDFVIGEHQNPKDMYASLAALGKHRGKLTGQDENILGFVWSFLGWHFWAFLKHSHSCCSCCPPCSCFRLSTCQD